ncbi:Thrombospondin type 3 repeat-containing protein [Candidatus Electrothrix aarhusensis]|uniref:Thrombospondin type 3 repeat-containing protein n=1 Tax=Candidatus Electrothrix aarhusensis TaxID=1859131 RepID=A0A444IY09_9BACT|nr:Thrombospondin type 3 repeat-containing protein [Candidatus Electrothrix aarhusensis]
MQSAETGFTLTFPSCHIGSCLTSVIPLWRKAIFLSLGLLLCLATAQSAMAEKVGFRSAVAGDGTLYVTYRDSADGYKGSVMKLEGSSWVPVGALGFIPNVRNLTSYDFIYHQIAIAVDSGGTPYIAFQSASKSGSIMEFNGSSWTEIATEEPAPYIPYYNPKDIAFDSNDTLYLIGGSHRGLFMSKLENLDWVHSAIGTEFSRYLRIGRIAFGQNDTPYIILSGEEWGPPSSKVIKSEGATWGQIGGKVPFLEKRGTPYSFEVIGDTPVIGYAHPDGSGIGIMSLNEAGWTQQEGSLEFPSTYDPMKKNLSLFFHSDADGVSLVVAQSDAAETANSAMSALSLPEVDSDEDGIPDFRDNCPGVANTDQADSDNDRRGDSCEDKDDDNDSVLNSADNCPLIANTEQEDNDLDEVGDACDPDDDNDGFIDIEDNCQFTVNTDQSNIDGDAFGDLCDADPDGDGITADDNCPNAPNPYQENNDGDSAGDVCDNDDDNDGFVDTEDNCQFAVNTDQEDYDRDKIGDACDLDIDADGVENEFDNCVWIFNIAQENADYDEQGDACDSDDDNDTVADLDDNCPLTANTQQENNEGDEYGDACDPDDDNDNIIDEADNCVWTANTDQEDTDNDGEGDVCDPDDDNDGVLDDDDNCSLISNADQSNLDGDEQGDVCDGDLDGDGAANETDNCPYAANGSQTDTDGDGEGNACDTDDDNDGVTDDYPDNCPLIENPIQEDNEGDGLGDICDADDDNDNISDNTDNCQYVANTDQADHDLDGEGNLCDVDVDGDGVPNSDDLCEFTALDTAVTDYGCSIEQLCPCEGPREINRVWKNHGKYVSCTAKTAGNFVKQGLITTVEKDAIVSEAAQSECGDKK